MLGRGRPLPTNLCHTPKVLRPRKAGGSSEHMERPQGSLGFTHLRFDWPSKPCCFALQSSMGCAHMRMGGCSMAKVVFWRKREPQERVRWDKEL